MANVTTGSAATQGTLWGRHPNDWAELEERKSAPLGHAVLDALGIEPGTKLLDAGCGAGMFAVEAARRGAQVTGLDASAPLLEIARRRLPSGRFDTGDLEHLPYGDGDFDVTMAINSVFYCTDMPAAMAELARVTRRSGRVAITAWGKAEDCEMSAVFGTLMGLLPARPPGGGPFALSAPGALESLLGGAGLRLSAAGATKCVFASPNWETCWRGMLSAGPIQGVVGLVGVEPVERAVRRAVTPFVDAKGAIEMTNTFLWVVGEK